MVFKINKIRGSGSGNWVFLLFTLSFCFASCYTKTNQAKIPFDRNPEAVIKVPELFFSYLKEGKFPYLWEILSAKSKAKISKEVADAVRKASDGSVSEEIILKDFETGGPYSRAYWEAYLANFDPDMALKECKWEVGKIKDDYAEVILRYKTSEKPAVLRLYKEDGEWRFGLVETFWTRK